jgi:phage tail sheath protein FI
VTGIYARNDVTRGVFKAPANEVVMGLTRFEANINKARNDVLNPEGINALRFFRGRGNRVWGARTMSSDPEWKYVNVRRLFIFLERSIDQGLQRTVFEPNDERLWGRVADTIRQFLRAQWRDGALQGQTEQEAFFIKCDRSTMTQDDILNGRLICEVGVATIRPRRCGSAWCPRSCPRTTSPTSSWRRHTGQRRSLR